MGKAEEMIAQIKEIAKDSNRIRNIGIAAHIDHGKTTLSDHLLAGAGMLSEELAGSQLFMDFDKQEQERGITIYSANASMIHEYEGQKYLINLIDTPGHVDFGGDVTRAMRAVDGVIVLVCAVEGVMPQTETVLRQALKEKVKPVLFINKVDRLIKELKLSPEEIQQRLMKHINDVNNLIRKYAPDEYKEKWLVDVQSGKVAFGSAYRRWAISFPFMQRTGITFKDIIDLTNADQEDELAKKAKVHQVLLDMVVRHLPSPKEAQKYRIPTIWTGDVDTPEGKAMIECDASGPLVGVVTNVTSDPHAGTVVTMRIFSGTIKEGQEVFLVTQDKKERVQQVALFLGPRRFPVPEIPAGNIIAVTGLLDAFAGETICDPGMKVAPFEEIKHIFEPVVTKAIEVKDVKHLPKMIELLRQRAREDPTLHVQISEDTGETLVSGLGELHIEAKVERFLKDKGIDIVVSPPIVIFRESVLKPSKVFEGKSPNRHNRFYIMVEPLEKGVLEALFRKELEVSKIRRQDVREITEKLVALGMDREEARNVWDIYDTNILLNMTRGVIQIEEVKELVVDAFRQICDEGPLAGEPCFGLKVKLMDAKLHEDAIHRGPAQVYPAVKQAIRNAMIDAGAVLFEPKQILRIDAPSETVGNVIREVQNRRGQILEMNEESGMSILVVKIPVAEISGFEAALKSATTGRGFQSLIDIVYEKVPEELKEKYVIEIRKRKGMKLEMPKIEED